MSKKADHMLAVFVLDNEKTARDFLKKLQRIDEADKNAEIVDAAIADRTKRGRIKVKQTKDVGAMKGGFGGGAIGVMVGAILLGPVGAAIGGVTGGTLSGLYARFRDKGIEDKFMRQIAEELEKGKSALFVQYVGEWSASRGAIEDAIKAVQAKMIYSTLPAERMAEIQALVETAAEELGGEEVVSDYEIETVLDEAAVIEAAPVEAAVVAEAGDDLTIIKGLGPKTAAVLTAAGISSYAQLASTSEPDLRQIFSAAHTAVPQNVNTWAMQASFAQRGDWTGLNALNQQSKAGTARKAAAPPPPAEPDDLTQLAGIGPKMAKALTAAGYGTYDKLASANEPQLRQAMHQADMLAPSSLPTWPMQATFAAKGDWQGLYKYNQKSSQGKAATSKSKSAAAKAPAPAAEPDDLTQLHGIGPRMASILAAGGVTTYAQMQHMSAEQLREVVSAGGALPPSSLATWSTQATYAAKGDWQGLAAYNKKQQK